ncbi:hypothetical protein PG999_002318 [Apiospora kogelbergensis]|uniref:Uncharacterized protein n=1 Tax=Apiospora kogelbergensis TaxID=1337665 RepID=A0AAW0R815_9PEZI
MVCGSAPRPLFFYACGTLLYREDSKKAKQCKVDFGRKLNGILSALKRVEASTRSTSTGIATWSIEVNRTLATGGHAKKPPSPGPLEMDAGASSVKVVRQMCDQDVWQLDDGAMIHSEVKAVHLSQVPYIRHNQTDEWNVTGRSVDYCSRE